MPVAPLDADGGAALRLYSGQLGNKNNPPIQTTTKQSLSYGILAGACLTKLPQILNITRAKSAAGLSPASFELESAGLAVHAAYGALHGLPFLAWGEALILLAQNLAILALVYHYGRAGAWRGLAVGGALAAAAAAIFTGVVGRSGVAAAYSANALLMVASRVPQIAQGLRSGSTGQLALPTYAINVVGCCARVFTSLQQGSAGAAMVRSYLLSLALNGALVAQILLLGPGGEGPLGCKRRAGRGGATPARVTRAAAKKAA